MHYISTRGIAPSVSFREVVRTGLAPDGGLYVPEKLPQFSAAEIASMASLSYTELALKIITPFVGDEIAQPVLKQLIEEAYASFRHTAIAPLTQISSQEYLLELFHGPTLAFKDFALQLLGKLLHHVLEEEDKRVTIVGATSGDTGSAAIYGCYKSARVRMFILHPKGRVSDVQRKQMTTVLSPNLFNIAMEGSFDECQDMVKAMFLNPPSALKSAPLMAINSINWTRIMVQVVYYFYAALRLGAPARSIGFSVPTGNFGDVYAGYVARSMGLPVHQFIVATNSNDILDRFLRDNKYTRAPMVSTLAPSMDIQVASNFERLLFDVHEGDGRAVNGLMEQFKQGSISLSADKFERITALFSSACVHDESVISALKTVYQQTGLVIDPHTAIGVEAARRKNRNLDAPMVILATAHPAKFPEALEKAGIPAAPLPSALQDLFTREERFDVLPASYEALAGYVAGKCGD